MLGTLIVGLALVKFGHSTLIYPDLGVFQLTASVSILLEYAGYRRKMFLDAGFQLNYALPTMPSHWRTSPVWAQRSGNLIQQPFNISESKSLLKDISERHEQQSLKNDVSAGEIYKVLEQFLQSFSFHQTCLLRSVCELAQHPFDKRHENIFTDLLTFLLTPSIHKGFAASEWTMQVAYESAENRGQLGENCADLYSSCQESIWDFLSHVVF